MQLSFAIDGVPSEYHRDAFLGTAGIRVGTVEYPLQSGLDPRTHFGFKLERSWSVKVGDHVVQVERQRPLVLAGFRPSHYSVTVDGVLAAEGQGR